MAHVPSSLLKSARLGAWRSPVLAILLGCSVISAADDQPLLAEVVPPAEGPWTDSFSMPFRGAEAWQVSLADKHYLWTGAANAATVKALAGQDIAFRAKFIRVRYGRWEFQDLRDVAIKGIKPDLHTAVEGDNFLLFGTVSDEGTSIRLTAVHKTAGDAELIATKLNALAADAYADRLAVARWALEHSRTAGNRTFWADAALTIQHETITKAAAQADQQKDLDLLLQTVHWAVEEVRSAKLAAQVASKQWIQELPKAQRERLAATMQKHDLVLYRDGDKAIWVSKGQFLTRTYQQRWDKLVWNDAKGYYQLGLWAERHGDVLPHARQLAHRAFTEGHRIDPSHAGLRQMLGLPAAYDDGSPTNASYRNQSGTVVVLPPDGWINTDDPITTELDASWTHPHHPTSYLGVNTTDFDREASYEQHLATFKERLQALPDHTISELKKTTPAEQAPLKVTTCTFSYTMNGTARMGEAALYYHPEMRHAAVLQAVYGLDERDAVAQIFEEFHQDVVFIKPAPTEELIGTDTESAAAE